MASIRHKIYPDFEKVISLQKIITIGKCFLINNIFKQFIVNPQSQYMHINAMGVIHSFMENNKKNIKIPVVSTQIQMISSSIPLLSSDWQCLIWVSKCLVCCKTGKTDIPCYSVWGTWNTLNLLAHSLRFTTFL